MDHQESLHSKFLEVMERRDQERAGREEAGGSRRRRGTSARPLPGRRNGLSPLPARPPSSLSSRRSPERASTSRNSPPANPTRIRNAALWTSTMSTGATTVSPTVSSSILPVAEGGSSSPHPGPKQARDEVPGAGTEGSVVGGGELDDGGDRIPAEREEVQGEVGEHQQVLPEDEGQRQEASAALQDVPLLPPAGPALLQVEYCCPSSSANAAGVGDDARKENSELLDAIVVSNDHRSYKFPDIGSMRMTGIDGNEDQGNEEAGSSAMAGKSHGNYEDDDDDNGEGADEEEGEGDSQYQQGHAHERVDRDGQNEHHHHLHQGLEDPQHDSTLTAFLIDPSRQCAS
ncbi:putative trihelix transcription factor GTL1 [Iris pallida]|uniref:Trihelix transcription factor GTL1 n=1 Tax=Iris pallida TaxID=29817 RepID=A0AAX6GC63_IRIPA|nr:putative trihelix transcription factor GTL1 [Iris pallida]